MTAACGPAVAAAAASDQRSVDAAGFLQNPFLGLFGQIVGRTVQETARIVLTCVAKFELPFNCGSLTPQPRLEQQQRWVVASSEEKVRTEDRPEGKVSSSLAEIIWWLLMWTGVTWPELGPARLWLGEPSARP